MVAVLIQDFRRQRHILDAGDFSKCFWPFTVVEVDHNNKSYIFLTMWFRCLLSCSCFNPPMVTLQQCRQRLIVRNATYVIRWPWWLVCYSNPFAFWKAKFHSLHNVLITPSQSSLIHPMRKCSQPMVSWLYVMYCSIYSIMFCLAVVTNVLFFSPPIPWPWYNERSLLKLLVPVLLPSLSLAHPCPPWGIVASLALQTVICYFLLLITNILHWTLVSGGSMNIIQNVDVACLRGEARDSSWNTGSHPLPSFPEKPWPLWPTQWCWNPQDPNG